MGGGGVYLTKFSMEGLCLEVQTLNFFYTINYTSYMVPFLPTYSPDGETPMQVQKSDRINSDRWFQ